MQGTRPRAHAQLCSATQAVKCAVALSSPSSLASVSLSFLSQLYFPHCHPDSPCCNFCNCSSHSFLVAIFHICLHCILTAFLGVVFTPTVGYSRPPSAVNDPTVTKNSENQASNQCPNHFFIKFPRSIGAGYVFVVILVRRMPP